MIILLIFSLLLIVWCLKLFFDPNRIKPMGNEQIRNERIKRGMSAKF